VHDVPTAGPVERARLRGRRGLFDVVDLFDDAARARLAAYAAEGPAAGPRPGFSP